MKITDKIFSLFPFAKNKKISLLILLLLIIAALLIVLDFHADKEKTERSDLYENANNFDFQSYISNIENKIKNMTEEITGSEASVSIGLKNGGEYIYAYDFSESNSSKKSEYVVVKDNKNNNSLVLIGYSLPEINGVAIVCKGGDKANIKLKITNMVSTAFNIPTNKIFVCGTN